MSRWKLFVPLGLFALVLGLAAYQLNQPKDDRVVSAMVGKPLPEFALPAALNGGQPVTNAMFTDGKPRLLNVWASWCLPCIAEAPQLEALDEAGVEIVGVAIRDKPEDVTAFLETHGDPYSSIGADDLSELQLALGSSGVPETFVIDGQGIIRHQHIGDIRPEHVPELLAELREAQQ